MNVFLNSFFKILSLDMIPYRVIPHRALLISTRYINKLLLQLNLSQSAEISQTQTLKVERKKLAKLFFNCLK